MKTAILIGILIVLIAVLVCYISLRHIIHSHGDLLRESINNAGARLNEEIEINWKSIQGLKSDISYLPTREELNETNPAWNDHPLYSIAKSLDSLNKYFTYNKD